MGYSRRKWRSGMIYRNECDQCKTYFEYDEYKLSFLPWYPDGFVFCPKCHNRLRHTEELAVRSKAPSEIETSFDVVVLQKPTVQNLVEQKPTEATQVAVETSEKKFCTYCGRHFADEDKFCGKCGAKR